MPAYITTVNARSLDTHRIVKRLRGVGFSDDQAETVTDLMREVREFDLSDLATKANVEKLAAEVQAMGAALTADIDKVRVGLTADIDVLRQEMRSNRSDLMAEIAGSQSTMLKWLVGLWLAQAGIAFTLMKLLSGH